MNGQQGDNYLGELKDKERENESENKCDYNTQVLKDKKRFLEEKRRKLNELKERLENNRDKEETDDPDE